MTEDQATLVVPERLAALARAMVETHRTPGATLATELVDRTCGDALATCADKHERTEQIRSAVALIGGVRPGGSEESQDRANDALNEALRQRAAVELQLQAAQSRLEAAETENRRAESERQELQRSLGLLRNRNRELEQERDTLRTRVNELDLKAQRLENAAEDAQLQLTRLRSTRQSVSESAIAVTEEMNLLKSENETLRRRIEEALQARDRTMRESASELSDARGRTADAAFGRVWERLSAAMPDVFPDTHVPTHDTFERLADALVVLLRLSTFQEQCVLQKLYELRDVSQQNDPMFGFLTMLKRSSLAAATREYVARGRERAPFAQLLRAHQAWAEAIATGLYKLVVRAPSLIADAINPRSWPIGPTAADAAVGQYLRKDGVRVISDQLGTEFRREAARQAAQDYEFNIRERDV
ncbi:MAG: hypothetical protein HZB38_14720 [Planctomycetes bacterium]|nr:hypothetical protein [Planctomycetota bacterium]